MIGIKIIAEMYTKISQTVGQGADLKSGIEKVEKGTGWKLLFADTLLSIGLVNVSEKSPE